MENKDRQKKIDKDCRFSLDFDRIIDRKGSNCEKYDSMNDIFGRDDALPLWVADMDFETPGFVVDAIKNRAAHHIFGYTSKYNKIYDAVSWWMSSRHDLDITPENIALSPSVQTIIINAINAYSTKGDAVIIPAPVYGPFFSAVKNCGRKIIDFALDIKNGKYLFNFDNFKKILKQEHPSLLLLCNPHNPGGRVWTKKELEQLVSICKKEGVKIISDEIHSDIIFAPAKHTSILTIDSAKDIAIVTHSTSKTFNTAGLSGAFAVIYNSKLKKAFDIEAEATHTDNINIFAKVAIEAAFTVCGDQYVKALNSYLTNNIQMVVTTLSKINDIDVMTPEGTYLVWSDFSKIAPWPKIMRRLLNNTKTALSGGTFFGSHGEGWFRINCATPYSLLKPAMERIVKEFK